MPSSWEERALVRSEREGKPPGMSAGDYASRLLKAVFVGGRLRRDGDVAGFFDWWIKAPEKHRRLVEHYAHWCRVKVERDRREPEECANAGAEALRHRLDYEFRETPSSVLVTPALIGQIFDTAERINHLCDAAGCDSFARERMHQIHGEMIAHGADSTDEIVRTIGATLAVMATSEGVRG